MSSNEIAPDSFLDDFAGLSTQLDVGLKLTSSLEKFAPVAKALTAIFDAAESVPVSLVGLSHDDQALSVTFSITLGTLEEIRNASPRAISAMNLMSQIIQRLSSCEPVLAALPARGSAEAEAAQAFLAMEPASIVGDARVLHLVG
jgi:hypothetical protein